MPFIQHAAIIVLIVIGGAVGVWAGESFVPVKTRQYGAERLDFEVAGQRAFLIQPTAPAAGGARPWIWYAPTFIGSLPDPGHAWMFTQLLAKGFAIGGIDVGEAYGNPFARDAYAHYHQFVVATYGLSSKACLLPQSRGGLLLYNWAAEHPGEVQCIGGIYPVGDLASYPGLAKASQAYGFTDADWVTRLAENNPIDRLAPLAQARIPILHLHGDADTVVPLERNSGVQISRYRALGGPGELIVVPGKGHQVCDEFFQSQRLVDFFIGLGVAAPTR